MQPPVNSQEPWIVRAGWWLTKRRSLLFAPLFATALVSSRWAAHPVLELVQDLAGVLCLWGGTRLRLTASSYHTHSHGTQPITAGPYAWVRHPIYCANFLLGLGIMLVAGWWPMVVVYLFLFIPVHALISRAEEVYLTRLYGQPYVDYCKQVPALFPWRKYRGPLYGQPGEFKMQHGQERFKAAGYAVGMMALIFFKQFRHRIHLSLTPLPPALSFWLLAVALCAILYRPATKGRRAWLRVAQAALAVGSILSLAIHIPNVWPTSSLSPVPSFVFVKAVAHPDFGHDEVKFSLSVKH